MSFDLNAPSVAVASEAGFTFEPTIPGSGQGIGATITVRGPHSAVVREMLRRDLAEAQARDLQAKRRGKEPEPLTLAQLEARLNDQAVTFTMGWAGFETAGAPTPYSPDAARSLYTAQPWIRDQVIEQARDLGNFTPALLTTSSSSRATDSAAAG